MNVALENVFKKDYMIGEVWHTSAERCLSFHQKIYCCYSDLNITGLKSAACTDESFTIRSTTCIYKLARGNFHLMPALTWAVSQRSLNEQNHKRSCFFFPGDTHFLSWFHRNLKIFHQNQRLPLDALIRNTTFLN